MNKKNIVIIAILAAVLIAIVAYIFISGNSGSGNNTGMDPNDIIQIEEKDNDSVQKESIPTDTDVLKSIDISGSEDVRVTMDDGREFTITVYPKVAPETSENFLSLVKDGFYNGLTFHRIIKDFMAQGGDPKGNGQGGSDKNIVGEFSENGFDNKLSHKRGVVSMARSEDYNSASSQFFICYGDASFLDGKYAAFGFVTDGMETVDSFLNTATDKYDKPVADIVIKKMEIVK